MFRRSWTQLLQSIRCEFVTSKFVSHSHCRKYEPGLSGSKVVTFNLSNSLFGSSILLNNCLTNIFKQECYLDLFIMCLFIVCISIVLPFWIYHTTNWSPKNRPQPEGFGKLATRLQLSRCQNDLTSCGRLLCYTSMLQ